MGDSLYEARLQKLIERHQALISRPNPIDESWNNGVVARGNGEVFIYYASSDTRCHVAATSVEKLLDYVMSTPEDPLRSYAGVQQRNELIRKNLEYIQASNDPRLKSLV